MNELKTEVIKENARKAVDFYRGKNFSDKEIEEIVNLSKPIDVYSESHLIYIQYEKTPIIYRRFIKYCIRYMENLL